MKNNILLIVLLTCLLNLNAQTETVNLKKYWHYRERLRKSFISIDPHVESEGYNLPASEIFRNYNTYSYLSWADNNAATQHYIGMLASELWLLKNNGQEYETTLLELFYAVIALERLDLLSETQWARHMSIPPNLIYEPKKSDINGGF